MPPQNDFSRHSGIHLFKNDRQKQCQLKNKKQRDTDQVTELYLISEWWYENDIRIHVLIYMKYLKIPYLFVSWKIIGVIMITLRYVGASIMKWLCWVNGWVFRSHETNSTTIRKWICTQHLKAYTVNDMIRITYASLPQEYIQIT